jgi:tetratricopeptide (TPR) repeat protein
MGSSAETSPAGSPNRGSRFRVHLSGAKRVLPAAVLAGFLCACLKGSGEQKIHAAEAVARPADPATTEVSTPAQAPVPEKPAVTTQARAHFLEGASAFREGRYEEAAGCFQASLRFPAPWEEYTWYYLLRARWESGDVAATIPLCREFLERFPQSPLRTRVRIIEARAYGKDPCHWGLALQDYEQLLSEEDRADLRLRYAALLESLERVNEAYENCLLIRGKWPRSAAASEARRRMREMEKRSPEIAAAAKEDNRLLEEARLCLAEGAYAEALSAYRELGPRPLSVSGRRSVLRGQVLALLGSGDLDRARSVLQSLMEKQADSREEIECLLAVGKGFWRRSRNAEAEPLLERLVDQYTDTAEAMEACYIMGRIREEAGDSAGAMEQYRRTRFLYPGTEWEQEAAWRESWCHYQRGEYGACSELLKACEQRGVWAGEELPRSRYWAARCLEKSGNHEEARQAYELIVRQHPDSFYGFAAERRMRGQSLFLDFSPGGRVDRIPESPSPGEELFDKLLDPAVPLLLEAGFSRDCVDRLTWLQVRNERPGMGLEDWVEAYFLAGDYARSIRLARGEGLINRLLQSLASGGEPKSLRTLRRIYPLPYWDLIRKESDRKGLDPFLVAGLIHQESLFMSDIRSPAGAVGLMQIMPSTGNDIARNIGMGNFRTSLLTDPEVNLRLGTAYLASLTERYDAQWHKVLANYNAGPGAVARWAAAMPGAEVDEFVEGISYRETRIYVRKVLFNGTVYQKLYGGGGRDGPA